jgi:hypothetical protein
MNTDIAFRSVYGRDPNPEETNRFNRIGKELDIRDNDAIWVVAFLLGHHLDLAKQMPEQMEQLVSQSLTQYSSALRSASKLAEAEFAATKARIEEGISQSVVTSAQREIAQAAQTVARNVARKSWLQWLGCAAVCGMMMISGAIYWGYRLGKAQGYARALDTNAAASWAATNLGQAAYKMDQNGDLRSLVECDRTGWNIQRSKDGKRKVCVVHSQDDGSIYGWYLP